MYCWSMYLRSFFVILSSSLQGLVETIEPIMLDDVSYIRYSMEISSGDHVMTTAADHLRHLMDKEMLKDIVVSFTPERLDGLLLSMASNTALKGWVGVGSNKGIFEFFIGKIGENVIRVPLSGANLTPFRAHKLEITRSHLQLIVKLNGGKPVSIQLPPIFSKLLCMNRNSSLYLGRPVNFTLNSSILSSLKSCIHHVVVNGRYIMLPEGAVESFNIKACALRLASDCGKNYCAQNGICKKTIDCNQQLEVKAIAVEGKTAQPQHSQVNKIAINSTSQWIQLDFDGLVYAHGISGRCFLDDSNTSFKKKNRLALKFYLQFQTENRYLNYTSNWEVKIFELSRVKQSTYLTWPVATRSMKLILLEKASESFRVELVVHGCDGCDFEKSANQFLPAMEWKLILQTSSLSLANGSVLVYGVANEKSAKTDPHRLMDDVAFKDKIFDVLEAYQNYDIMFKVHYFNVKEKRQWHSWTLNTSQCKSDFNKIYLWSQMQLLISRQSAQYEDVIDSNCNWIKQESRLPPGNVKDSFIRLLIQWRVTRTDVFIILPKVKIADMSIYRVLEANRSSECAAACLSKASPACNAYDVTRDHIMTSLKCSLATDEAAYEGNYLRFDPTHTTYILAAENGSSSEIGFQCQCVNQMNGLRCENYDRYNTTYHVTFTSQSLPQKINCDTHGKKSVLSVQYAQIREEKGDFSGKILNGLSMMKAICDGKKLCTLDIDYFDALLPEMIYWTLEVRFVCHNPELKSKFITQPSYYKSVTEATLQAEIFTDEDSKDSIHGKDPSDSDAESGVFLLNIFEEEEVAEEENVQKETTTATAQPQVTTTEAATTNPLSTDFFKTSTSFQSKTTATLDTHNNATSSSTFFNLTEATTSNIGVTNLSTSLYETSFVLNTPSYAVETKLSFAEHTIRMLPETYNTPIKASLATFRKLATVFGGFPSERNVYHNIATSEFYDISHTITTATTDENKIFCPRMHIRDVWFPPSTPGIIKADCPNGTNGLVEWCCLENGTWSVSEEIDFTSCVSDAIAALLKLLQSSLSTTRVLAIARQQANILSSHAQNETLPGYIKENIGIINKIIKLQDRGMQGKHRTRYLNNSEELAETMQQSVDKLLDEKLYKSWNKLNKEDRSTLAHNLTNLIDDIGFLMADAMKGDRTEIKYLQNIVFQVVSLRNNSFLGKQGSIKFPNQNKASGGDNLWNIGSGTISVPCLKNKNAQTNFVFALYRNLAHLLGTTNYDETNAMVISQESESHQHAANSYFPKNISSVINSYVISASVHPAPKEPFKSKKVKFILQHKIFSSNKTRCVFWKKRKNISLPASDSLGSLAGHWSSKGCNVIASNRTHTMCECDHLTNFAILMDVMNVVISKTDERALTLITWIGCILSVLCLIACLICFNAINGISSIRNSIHKNLCFNLALVQTVFLLGVDKTNHKLLCSIIAGVLHYLFLVVFAWMCVEGMHIYVSLVKVFEIDKISRLVCYYIFAYGTPALVVAISASLRYDGYGSLKNCWLRSGEDRLIWSFVGPALCVICVNVFFFCVALNVMRDHRIPTAAQQSRVMRARSWLKGSCVLLCLLGITWIPGILFIDSQSVFMAYLFTVCNSLQGVFIFLFHCLLNEKVRVELIKQLRRKGWCPTSVLGRQNVTSSSVTRAVYVVPTASMSFRRRRSSVSIRSNSNSSAISQTHIDRNIVLIETLSSNVAKTSRICARNEDVPTSNIEQTEIRSESLELESQLPTSDYTDSPDISKIVVHTNYIEKTKDAVMAGKNKVVPEDNETSPNSTCSNEGSSVQIVLQKKQNNSIRTDECQERIKRFYSDYAKHLDNDADNKSGPFINRNKSMPVKTTRSAVKPTAVTPTNYESSPSLLVSMNLSLRVHTSQQKQQVNDSSQSD